MTTPAAATVQTGVASWYGPGFENKRTASGERFSSKGLTAAHRSLPFGTKLKVTRGKKSVHVVVNDRGPFHKGRVVDLSKEAARQLDMLGKGTASVQIEVQ